MSLLSFFAKLSSSTFYHLSKRKTIFLFSWLKETFLHTFYRDNCSLMAAAISFYAILSVIPLFLVFMSISGYVLHSSKQALQTVIVILWRTSPTSIADGFQVITDLMAQKTVFGIIGILGSIWAASRIFSAVEDAMNTVWKVEKNRSYWHSKFLTMLLVPITVLVMLSSLAFTALYAVAKNIEIPVIGWKLSQAHWISQISVVLLPLVLGVVMFFLTYKIIPNRKVSGRAALIGALCASGLWEIAKYLFDIYIKHYGNFQKMYGSFATIVVMLIWVYYSSYILLLGAEIGSNYEETKKRWSMTPFS
jgi:membrane protein